MTLCEMKSSGVEWIGYVPLYWNILKGKYCLSLLQRPIFESDGVITCFRDGVVTLRSCRREEGFTVSLKEIGYQGIEPGDIVVHGMDGFAGAIGISDSRGKASPVLIVLDTNLCKKFVVYYLRVMAFTDVFLALSTGIRIRSCDTSWNKLKNLPYPIPPKNEQIAIANFLDTKCAEIDALKADIEKQIETLQEYKKSIITEAVTKGLDRNVEMKDSNVDYIGKYPFDWKLIKLKYVCQKLDRHFDSDSQILICSNKGTIELRTEQTLGQVSEKKDAFQGVAIGDLLIHGMDTWHGAVGISGFNGKCTKVVHVCSSEQNKTFIAYFLKMLAIKSVYKAISMGVRENTSDFRSWVKAGSIYVTLPEIVKQKEIADYLDKKCSEIDSIIRDKKTQLNTLSLYASSLIYEYVTGKKAVPANF